MTMSPPAGRLVTLSEGLDGMDQAEDMAQLLCLFVAFIHQIQF